MKKYMPSNGTELIGFTSEFCDNCLHQHPDPERRPQCSEVLLEALIGNRPPEWAYDSSGEPTCAAFVRFDWGGRNGDDWNEPPPGPDPEDPAQLLLPFCITELFGFDDPGIVVTRKAIFEKAH